MDSNKDNSKSFVDKILGDVSKTSATKQLIIGASSGWVTGYLAMKVGRTAAVALGSGIIILELANQKGYIKINWDKVNKQINKVSDKVEEHISGQSASWMDKVENFVDDKVDKVEELVKNRQKAANKWYSSLTGSPDHRLKEIHVFLISFVAGIAIGIGTS
ncbi:hypothetical protein RN001_016265 [Aquatica leii]|uniref:FUN14 domain-containing protein 1 n=1 Tax=Aquatica leii TaxID=1421715 RepID=A0AAN7NZ54_9COLE|nr:hypothetical protein RN001_016265 [Aquatica leii]